jgi:hypothetical protein
LKYFWYTTVRAAAKGALNPLNPLNPPSSPRNHQLIAMEVTDTPRRRQSCDRCHGQKLRCTRASNDDTGACIRCRRQGAQCIYSSCLPKGRPSMYRLDGPSSDSTTLPPQIRRPKPQSGQGPGVAASSVDPSHVTNIESLPDAKQSTNSHSPGNSGPMNFHSAAIDPSE